MLYAGIIFNLRPESPSAALLTGGGDSIEINVRARLPRTAEVLLPGKLSTPSFKYGTRFETLSEICTPLGEIKTHLDGNGLELGLAADVTTTSASNGTFTISLKHQPGIKNGSCDIGETDVEVAFVLEVK